MSGKDRHELNLSPDWKVDGNSFPNASTGIMQISNSVVDSSGCSSVAMVDSFGLPMWAQNHCVDAIVENGGSGMNWASNVVVLPNFPADSGLIERAARLSCFSGGNFEFGVPDPPLARCSWGFGMMQGIRDVFRENESKAQPGGRSQEIDMTMDEVNNESLLLWKPVQGESSCMNDEKNRAGMPDNECDEAECSGRGAREEPNGLNRESPCKGLDSKTRKRGRQDNELDENTDTPQPSVEVDQSGKQPSQGSDLPKEEYMHVRARRGQATNSHSLAERVRREKISERMKFLQDLVPGCNKVTGKAVMLDEIINYVQSLQRQVEFLSMKLATVNSGMDFEACLSKDPRAGPAFSPCMGVPFSPLHLLQPGFVAETLSRSANIRTPTASQVRGVWDNELHNVIHTGLGSSAPVHSQDLIGRSLPPGHLKTEP